MLLAKADGAYIMSKSTICSKTPSLVVNITDKCNMRCIYCPPNGENVEKSYSSYYDEIAVLQLIHLAKLEKFKMIRFTGGEPFLAPERLERFIFACKNDFNLVQINTNGIFDNYQFNWLVNYAKTLSLKFSLDSVCHDEFKSITQKDYLQRVLDNIEYAISMGFEHISINTVLSIQSFENIKKLIEYAVSRKIDVKLLTISSYCGSVNVLTPNSLLEQIILYLKTRSKDNGNAQLIGNRGISMLTYQIENSLIYLVDHSCKKSKTPERTYFSSCKSNCSLFPCESGAISINLSSNGCLSVCRGDKIKIGNVFFKNSDTINNLFHSALIQFNNCIKININNL